MAKKHVKSTDPRKPAIVSQLKRISGGNKVTLLTEIEDGLFQGRCLKYVGAGNGTENTCLGAGSYKALGDFKVRIDFGSDPDTGSITYAVVENRSSG